MLVGLLTPGANVYRLIAAILCLSLIAAACGGSSDDESSADGVTTTSSDGSDDASTTVAPATTGPATTEAASGDSGSTFCEAARAIDDRADEIEAMGLGVGETFRLQFEELIPMTSNAASLAPADLDLEFDYYLNRLTEFRDLLETVDYDVFSLSEEQLELFDDPRMDAFDDGLTDYTENVCLITDDDTGAGTDEGVGLVLTEDDVDALLNGPRRGELLGELTEMGLSEAVAECVMRETLLAGAELVTISADFAAVLTQCGVTAEQLANIGVSLDPEAAEAAFEQLASILPLLAGSPAAAQAVVPVLTGMGVDPTAAECIANALAEPDAAETLTDISSFTGVLEACGVTIEELLAAVG